MIFATDLREAAQTFVDGMPAGWKVFEHGDKSYAGRRFEYRNGTQVLLSAQPDRWVQDPTAYMRRDPFDLVKSWSVQVNLRFSAGPEVSTTGKYADVHVWAQHRDGWLAIPYTLQEAKSAGEAELIAATLPGNALALLAVVFDLEPIQGRVQVIKGLVRACRPAPAGRRQG